MTSDCDAVDCRDFQSTFRPLFRVTSRDAEPEPEPEPSKTGRLRLRKRHKIKQNYQA